MRLARSVLVWGLVALLSGAAWAQGDTGAGSGFGGARFAISPAQGSLEFGGRAGWLWRVGSTHRIVLETDVRVVLGGDVFYADAASLWLEQIPSDRSGVARYQVFGVFRDVRADAGAIDVRAQMLPVRGVVDADGAVRVRVDARFDGPPGDRDRISGFGDEAESMFGERVLGIASVREDVSRAEVRDGASVTDGVSPGGAATPAVVREAEPVARQPVFRPEGVFSISVGDRIVVDGGEASGRSTITASGGVVLQYREPASGQSVELRAERAVVFLKDGAIDRTLSRLGADRVEGIYLEGGVVGGDERWTVRSPKVYLDVDRGRALMLDAVFWTTDERTGMPVYVRAEAVRQESRRVFSAEGARLSNSAFFEPDFYVGMRRLEVTLEDGSESGSGSGGFGVASGGAAGPGQGSGDGEPGNGQRVRVVAESVTLRLLGVPVLWLPGFSGDPDDFPLSRVRIGDSNRTGLSIESRWNALSLFRVDAPGVDMELLIDYFGERGFAGGFEGNWQTESHRGGLFAYLLPDDNGTDVLGGGREIERDGETRGAFLLQDLWAFRDGWTLVTEASYLSDEAYLPAFEEQRASDNEDFRTRLRLERRTEDWKFSLEAAGSPNDFVGSESLLQARGYRVDRLPEARAFFGSRDVFAETLPGLLSYNFEARAGVLRLQFSEVDAADYGLTTDSLADDAFGTMADVSLGDVLRASGLDEGAVSRFDTRHELVGTLDTGPVRVTPFVVGRVTAYDTDFAAFSPGQRDEVRTWGAGGVTLSTTLQKIDNEADSAALDIHRVRHVVEPSLTVWHADANIETGELPVFDDEVEDLLTGTLVRAAVDQTWQTKRGGPGRWRDVDVLTIRTEYVWTSNRAGTSAIPRWYDARPELSNPGEYIGMSAVWQPTEVVAVAGETVYDLETNEFARSSGGVLIEHRPGFVTSFELRRIEALDATYGAVRARYRLTEKYGINTVATYDFDANDFQSATAVIQRRFQVGTLGVGIGYDNIRGETSFSFVFRPGGARGGLAVDPTFGG